MSRYLLINNSRFKTKTLDKLIKFSLRGFGAYLKKDIIIEICDLCYWEKGEDIEYDDDLNWGGEAIGDEKIFIFINPKMKFPTVLDANWTPKTRYISGQYIKNAHELLLYLIVHEASHLMQFDLKDPIIASNIIKLDEEAQSDIIAMIKLDQHRRAEEKRRFDKKSVKKDNVY